MSLSSEYGEGKYVYISFKDKTRIGFQLDFPLELTISNLADIGKEDFTPMLFGESYREQIQAEWLVQCVKDHFRKETIEDVDF